MYNAYAEVQGSEQKLKERLPNVIKRLEMLRQENDISFILNLFQPIRKKKKNNLANLPSKY